MELQSITMSFELSNGESYSGEFTKIDRKNWNKIEKDQKVLMKLIDGNEYFVELKSIDKYGISFNYVSKQTLYSFFHKRKDIMELFIFKSDK